MTIRWISILIVSLPLTAVAEPPTYRVKEITPPASERTYGAPKALNDLGEFIGDSWTGFGEEENHFFGYVWKPTTGKFKLLRAAGERDSRSTSNVYGINNRSQIVGISANLKNYYGRATLWTRGTPRFLAHFFPDEFQTVARAINDKGQIVGEYHRHQTVAVMWDGNTRKELGLDKSQYYDSYASDINEYGFVVGSISYRDGVNYAVSHAYRWDPNTQTAEILPTLPGWFNAPADYAQTVTKWGKVAGSSSGRAVSWSGATLTLSDLSSLALDGEHGANGAAQVNEKNEILVSLYQNDRPALFYVFKNEAYPLQSLIRFSGALEGCVELSVSGKPLLNNKGVIVIPGRNTCTGGENIYVLKPVYP